MPDHGDGLADLAVAMAMQGEENPDKMTEAMATLEKAEKGGASGSSFDKRRCVFYGPYVTLEAAAEAAAVA